MRQIVYTLFLLAIISKYSLGQTTSFGFQEGTIFKKDGSSLKCLVEFAVTYHSKVSYKLTEDGRELSLKSSEIASIETPYKYIENITLDNKERLMTIVANGKVKLFNHVTINPGKTQQEQGVSYNFSGPPTVIYALMKDGIFFELKKKDFKAKLSDLLNDQTSLVERINSGEFKFEDIESIINEYNDIHKMVELRRQITAKVIDSETKKPVKGAKVTILGSNIEATTNFLGFIQITIDTVDILIIEHPEYEIGRIKIPEMNGFQISLTRTPIEKD
jgi:hypothetical protein